MYQYESYYLINFFETNCIVMYELLYNLKFLIASLALLFQF